MSIDRICILGPSGIGKSPLAELFTADRFEPRRRREPRNQEEVPITVTAADYEEQRRNHSEQRREARYSDPHGVWAIEVYEDVSFLKVRGKDQLLEHGTPHAPSTPLRIEIFAPTLCALFQHHRQLPSNLASRVDPKRTLVVILNPTSTSFRSMTSPTPELVIAVLQATTERARVQGGPIDLGDALERVRSLDAELSAWRRILRGRYVKAAECLCWQHFEFR
jgi:hypothetical protein